MLLQRLFASIFLVCLTISSSPTAAFPKPKSGLQKFQVQDIFNQIQGAYDSVSDSINDAIDSVENVINDVSASVEDAQEFADEVQEGVEAAEDIRDILVEYLIDVRDCLNGSQEVCQDLFKELLALDFIKNIQSEVQEWIAENITIEKALDFYVMLITDYPEVIQSLPIEEIVQTLLQGLLNPDNNSKSISNNNSTQEKKQAQQGRSLMSDLLPITLHKLGPKPGLVKPSASRVGHQNTDIPNENDVFPVSGVRPVDANKLAAMVQNAAKMMNLMSKLKKN